MLAPIRLFGTSFCSKPWCSAGSFVALDPTYHIFHNRPAQWPVFLSLELED